MTIVGRRIRQFAGKYRVPGIRGSTLLALGSGAAHGGAHRTPNAVRTNEHIAVHFTARLQNSLDASTLGQVLVRGDTVPILHDALGQGFQVDFLQIRSINDACVGHVAFFSGTGEIKFSVPFCANSVFDAVHLVTSHGELFTDLLVQFRIHFTNDLHGIASQLNWATESFKG